MSASTSSDSELRDSGINRTELLQLIRARAGVSLKRLSRERLIEIAGGATHTRSELSPVVKMRERLSRYIEKHKRLLGNVTGQCTSCTSSDCLDFKAYVCYVDNEGLI